MIRQVYRFIFAFILFTTPISAILPPLYQSLSEYQALLTDARLENFLGSGDWIKSIKRDNNSFIITTTKHTLRVDVVYEPQKQPGPAKYHFVFQELENIDQSNQKH